MTDEHTANTGVDMRAGRMRVPRSRGAVGGAALIVGGLFAGLVPFVGPYGNLAYTPSPNATWKWTAARGWLEVLPGAVAVVAGMLLIASTNRIAASFAGWLGVAAGAWLVLGPALAEPLSIDLGTPDPNQTAGIRATEAITFFYGIGAAIVLVAGLTLGRLSVHSVRDVQVAERRAAEEAERRAEEERFAEEHRLFTQQQAERNRIAAEEAERDRQARESAAAYAAQGATQDSAPARTQTDDTAHRVEHDRYAPPPSETTTTEVRQRQADERFAAERARIAEEHRQKDADADTASGTASDADTASDHDDAHEPAHAAQQTSEPASSGQPREYPPFYGNRS